MLCVSPTTGWISVEKPSMGRTHHPDSAYFKHQCYYPIWETLFQRRYLIRCCVSSMLLMCFTEFFNKHIFYTNIMVLWGWGVVWESLSLLSPICTFEISREYYRMSQCQYAKKSILGFPYPWYLYYIHGDGDIAKWQMRFENEYLWLAGNHQGDRIHWS